MGNGILVFGIILYIVGFLLGIGAVVIGAIPVFGDLANALGSLVEEALQLGGLIIVAIGVKK